MAPAGLFIWQKDSERCLKSSINHCSSVYSATCFIADMNADKQCNAK